MSQTSYSVNQAAGFEGMLASDFEPRSVKSLAAEVAIPFGKFVCKGTADNQAKLPVTATDVTTGVASGIALSSQSMPSSESGAATYAIKDEVSVLEQGVAWVKVEDSVAVGGAVYVRQTAGGLGLGSFAGAAGAGLSLLPSAKYLTAASANGLAQVQLNLP